MAHGQKVGFCSVMVVTTAALNLAACEVNEGRQVNPLGHEKRNCSPFLPRHTAESDTERLGVLMCVMWLLTVAALSPLAQAAFFPP